MARSLEGNVVIVTPESRQILNENFTRESLNVWFSALDDLRESGQVNMGQSASILENSGLARRVAQAVARSWMATFSNEPVECRVEEAYEAVYALLKRG